MQGSKRLPSDLVALPLFTLGDRALLRSENKKGTVVGVCDGEVAYDVLCGRECLQNLSPKLIRLA
jgi:hypothetical protein